MSKRDATVGRKKESEPNLREKSDGTKPGAESSQCSLLVYLQAKLPSLNQTERQIADYILADPERVISSSISEIRRGCGASVGSIVGFCKGMGRKGFSDFKIALARDLAQAGFSAARRPLTGKNDASLFESVFTFHAQCLNETLQINTEEAIVRASRMLETARRIEFFSIGMSYPVAYTACAKLRLIGFPVSVECDAHLQLINATQLRKGDVAFAISCSGRTRETVKCLAIARENEASTLCLTNCLESPITAYADVCLYATPSEIKYFQAPLASRVTQLALIDALFVGIALRRKGKTMRILKSAGEKLLEHRIQ